MSFQLEFLPAYTISNEHQRWATAVIPGVKRVLTVAGSGDQAIFYKIAGATVVDTFDITKNAGVIQDIKYTAIKQLASPEYSILLKRLYHTKDVMSVSQMGYLSQFLTEESRNTIKQNNDGQMFTAGLPVDEYPYNIPTYEEYQKLQKLLKEPFRFIRCGLEDLSTKISGKYDIINLSNIFDYCYDGPTQGKILADLAEHLNVGGHIAYLPQVQRFNYEGVRIRTTRGTEIVYKETKKYRDTKMILFQRTR